MNNWQLIRKLNPTDLTEGRLQLHYAIQFIAATGATFAEPLPDYSHTSLTWNSTLKMFVGSTIRSPQPFQVALDPISLTLLVLNRQSQTIASLPLPGITMATGLNWLKQEISKLGIDASEIKFLSYPPDDFPDHPLAHGASFDSGQAAALRELANYYANTHKLLQEIITTNDDATADRIWPHHFDLATLIMLPGMINGSPLTVGVGLSPGDTSYNEPYWYVSPYPYPNTAKLPAIAGNGFWHTQHWVGAVLPTSYLLPTDTAETQQQQVKTFLNSAVTTSIALLKSEAQTPVL